MTKHSQSVEKMVNRQLQLRQKVILKRLEDNLYLLMKYGDLTKRQDQGTEGDDYSLYS